MKPTEENWTAKSPYDRFFYFIADKVNRYAELMKTVEKLGFNSTVLAVAGNKHIFIFPHGQKSLRASRGVSPFKGQNPYLLCAHYDRVEGSQGANDNSIAVFHLLKAAMFFTKNSVENWIIVFTDKEELNPNESFEKQGAFTLAEKLRVWGLDNARIYNFDACGRGGAFTFSTTTDHILKNAENPSVVNIKNNVSRLRNHALSTANLMRLEKVLLAPTPFSDDVGFLRAGFASQTITMLPVEEATHYETILRNRSDFADLIISGKTKEPSERNNLPKTWHSLNSSMDKPSRLTPEYFGQTVNFIVELCKK
jgi:hypothetical protein